MSTMLNNKGLPNLANWSYSGRMSKLPPRSPLPSTAHVLTDCAAILPLEKKHVNFPKDHHRQHQRTSSECFAEEELPAWLDDLLNEPETPSGRGMHRRSSSDSVAFLDTLGSSSMQDTPQLEFNRGDRPSFLPSPVSVPFDTQKNIPHLSFPDISSTSNMASVRKGWGSSANSFGLQNGIASKGDGSMLRKHNVQQAMEHLVTLKPEHEKLSKHEGEQSAERSDKTLVKATAPDADQCDQKECSGKKEGFTHDKPTTSDTDPKRTKQHYAQRSRVRKLQYIAELERVVSVLHAEGSDAAAELAFLKQQHLILSLENRALMQRINSVAQEKQIKDAQYELLTKEVDRLREVYCNQRKERLKLRQRGDATAEAADNMDLRFRCLSLTSLNHLETGSSKKPGGVNGVAPYPCMMPQKS